MLQNAQYPVLVGLGIISLMDGDVSGGDNISSYTGTYVQEGDRFAATLSVKRVAFRVRNGQSHHNAPSVETAHPACWGRFFWPLL